MTNAKPGRRLAAAAWPPEADPAAVPTLLGIEAGGTKTVAVAVGGGLPSPLRGEFGPANLWLLSDAQLVRRLRAVARAMPRPDAIGIGMAGTRTPSDRARLERAAARVWPGVPCHPTSDLEVALMAAGSAAHQPRASTTSAQPPAARVLIVSGTGSCCLGRAADGRTERLGGWGHVIGDRGSGYDIALSAIKAVIRSSDHDRRWPPLGARVLRALLLNVPEDLVEWAPHATKTSMAALAIEVFAAAAEGDRLAASVIANAARTLAADGAACAALIASPGEPVQFVLAGSVLVKQPLFAARVSRMLRAARPSVTVTVLGRESVWGAVELARGLLGLSRAARVRAAPPPAPTHAAPLETLRQSPTEQRNPRSANLDRLSIRAAVTLMLEEDARITPALLAHRAAIARGVRLIAGALANGGRLFYIGAGTSGRLGVLDASECPPTFRTPKDMVQGIIAGGQSALWSSIEGAEDDEEAGRAAVSARGVTRHDVVVGIAASGRTPFVWGALREAKRRGAATIVLCFNPYLRVAKADRPTLVIAPDVGPEVLTGSTRLKAGTATKMVLNIFTTLAMVRLGKVKSNLMIDLNASNAKLRDRAIRITQALTGVGRGAAESVLEQVRWSVRDACARLATRR